MKFSTAAHEILNGCAGNFQWLRRKFSMAAQGISNGWAGNFQRIKYYLKW
jgi:hypothetical protein